ncbi:hypothetical protein DSO57_1039435 [Entomophthora muscae]|uniref:Uncharacterized protein n=1 Tax=Entomophthora muscae TaxID=34485 RepID=A0ACC2SN33_9FUNG|nr:hypothetical protein DSO57_1039435 [Entomophthora muscae]
MHPILFCLLGLVRGDVPGYVELSSAGGNSFKLPAIFESGPFRAVISHVLPASARDLYKILFVEPPKRLEVPKNVKHGTIKEVQENFINAVLASCEEHNFISHTCACPETYADLQALDDTSVYALAAIAVNKKQKRIVVSYRGTVTFQNLLDDFDFQMTSIPGLAEEVQVHRGFYLHYLSLYYPVRAAMTRYIESPAYANYTLQITGFSLGGAIGTIALPGWISFLEEKKDKRNVELFTYSSPRAGNAHFADYINGLNVPVTRYTFQNDLVPHTPPRSANYVHVGVEIHQEITLDGSKNFTICSQEYDEDPNCAWKNKDHLDLNQHIRAFNRTFPAPMLC